MITLDLNSEVPIYSQLSRQIILAIAKGDVSLGEPMPTVRQLAEDLGINPMTVSKTYAELKQMGYLDGHLRKGTVVPSQITPNPDFWKTAKPELELIIAKSLLNGISQQEFEQVTRELYTHFKEELSC